MHFQGHQEANKQTSTRTVPKKDHSVIPKDKFYPKPFKQLTARFADISVSSGDRLNNYLVVKSKKLSLSIFVFLSGIAYAEKLWKERQTR